MKGVDCVPFAKRVRGQREGVFPPSLSPMCLQPCDLTQSTFPFLRLGHSVGKERVFKYSRFLHQGIITVS